MGSHASGFAYGGLSPLGGAGIPGPMAEVAQEGMGLHLELAYSLSDGWAGHYATTKPDGLLWTGTTEEEAGFDEPPWGRVTWADSNSRISAWLW